MRVRCKGKPSLKYGLPHLFKIKSPQGTLRISGCARWGRRISFRIHETGIEFINLSAAAQAALASLAEFGFLGENVRTKKSGPGSSRRGKRLHATGLPNYYMILGVKQCADPSEIHQAYRLHARKLHPDVNPDPDAAQKFIAVKEAYDVLRDPIVRQRYDRNLAA
jgi:hypothetical protein